MPSLRVVEVTKHFGHVEAIDNVTFDIKDGEYLCILGPTGSGKTTLLRLLAGILKPDVGEIFLNNKVVNKIPAEERDAVYVPQTYALFPHMTVLENVMFGPLAKGLTHSIAEEVALKVLAIVKLDHRADAFPHELSGGMQQRVALARGLASGAKLLLLDEPLGALDARLRVEIRWELKRITKESGSTVIHVTHDQEEAMILGDRILVLRRGRVLQYGTSFHIYKRPDNIFVAHFVGSNNFLEGIVSQRGRNVSIIKLRGNLKLKVADTSHESEEAVIVAVREENIFIRKISEEKITSGLLGEVVAIRFLGSYTRYEVVLANRDRLVAKISVADSKMILKLGDRVSVSIEPRDTVVYEYPTLGLKRELEVY